jgi:beta-glucosidase
MRSGKSEGGKDIKLILMKFIINLLVMTLFGVFVLQAQAFDYPFQDPENSIDIRADDLINRLTLEEKASLMVYNSPAIERLGVPEYNWWNECLHGVGRAGKAKVFPQSIGMAATFDDELIKQVATAISDEARAKHHAALKKGNRAQYTGLTFWTPNINIFRDPRWGRGQETYGEDPYLTSRMGTAFVRGLQGDDPKYLKASACAKHYVVHSGPEELRHYFNALPDETDFRETYLPAFKALVDAGVESVMCAYNRLYDEPCCGSKYLLNEILKEEWGFQGHIVTDCGALDDIWTRHKVVDEKAEAAAMAANAGVNLNCGDVYRYLPMAIEKGLVEEATIDANLKQLLRTRFKLGLFDPQEQVPWSNLSPEIVNNEQHRELAYRTASKSIVMLKNNGVLPLDMNEPKSLLVAGPTAADMTALMANYNGFSGNMVTILEGISNRVDAGTTVDYSQGFLFNNDSLFHGYWRAGMADIIVACIGLNTLLEGEEGDAMFNPHGGDRLRIELPSNQIAYLREMRNRYPNKPIIVIVTGGGAVAMPEINELADAILFAWYPGEQGGNAIADVLFGNVNPSGKLPVTFYESTDDLPAFEDYNMKGRTYRYFDGKPLYPFGYGLGFSEFDYDNLIIHKTLYGENETISLSFNLSNAGDRDGEEVVQIYVREVDAKEGRPTKSLIDFKRVPLAGGISQEVKFQLPVSRFARWNPDERVYRTNAGKYLIQVGASSEDIRMEKEIIINPEKI